jgi:metal-responsive CopG/Arc/MetJ family transcriptional regulator
VQVKTTISLPDDTFRRVDDAAKRLGVSRSEFFARAAERWLESLDADAINRATTGLDPDHEFTDAAAAALASSVPQL